MLDNIASKSKLMDSRCHAAPVWYSQVHEHRRQFAFKLGSKEKRAGAFDGISGVAVNDKTGTVAVAGCLNKRI